MKFNNETAMKAIDRPYPKIINGASQFVIPVFQRDYSWSEENCRQLWKDILAIAADSGDRGHFIGSVVYVATGDSAAGFTRWLLIDGQQPVTTLTLLLTALRDHIRDKGWQGSENGPTPKRIEAYFLRNVQEEGDREVKLRLRRHDDATLQALVNAQELPVEPSPRIRDNYELFRELLLEEDPETVYMGVNRLVVVDVTLERGVDDPQLIFESLNSTGVDLSPSDLIRNFILMRLPEKDQTRLYEAYWCKIEALFRGSERVFDNFIRDFLALRAKAAKLERSDRVYVGFRREFATIGADPQALESLLADLLQRARHYAAFAVRSSDDELGRAFASLRRLGDVPAIAVMRLYEAHETTGSLNRTEFLEAIGLLESYLLRRVIIGAQTRGYGLEFAKLAYRIDDTRPLASLKVAMARMPATYAFPGDTEFEKALLEADIYHKRVCFHLLDALENRGSKEASDTSTYSIEHILPQNEKLPEAWRAMLGPDWQAIQQTWLHSLGNLTLTGYNSRYSDRPFHEKKTIEGGFAESSVRLNLDIRDALAWTNVEIEARGHRLAKRALEIWGRLDADPTLIREMETADKKARANRRTVDQVAMTAEASALFALLRAQIIETFPDVIEMAESKSVSYHDPEFFLELIPRKRSIGLLIALDFNEVEGHDGFAQDTADYTFVVNASHQGGVLVVVHDEGDIDRAMVLVSQARELIAGA
ncbi:DUF262 and DUF1524 domain-containing protein [Pararhodobacter sp. SW119]|uniref:DUF262 and DUF1524 domain-containing protein n=1 Tax=Pararhodobacter sp. SW119 TaxID=2780075 RepID=UPI001AE0A456|nr:DUF262 and DUF1524 domain-containing protein [Pararhodobacter sp. SW119]